MNLSELKQNPVPALIKIASGMGIDNLSRSRKQDTQKVVKTSTVMVYLKYYRMGLDFYVPPTVHI